MWCGNFAGFVRITEEGSRKGAKPQSKEMTLLGFCDEQDFRA